MTRTLNVFILYRNIVLYVIWYVGYGYFYLIYGTFWNRSKKFDFIVKQFLDNECSITIETFDKIKYGFVEKVFINAP